MHPTYEQHLLGRLLPAMGQDDFQRFAAGIAARGLDEEIVLYQGKILDGWSRYRACQAVRVEPRFREFAGDDPMAYVLSKNVERRHMSPVQILKVLEAARPVLEAEAVARKRAGVRDRAVSDLGKNSSQGGRVSEQIAKMAGVSMATVKDYHAVQTQASPQLKEAVDGGEVAISDAAEVARHQLPEQQTEALERVRSGEASTLQKAVAKARAASPTRDPLGLPIPDDLAAAFRALPQFKTAKACLTRTEERVNELLSSPAGTRLTGDDWPALGRQLRELRTRLDQLEPYTLCPDCLGQGCPAEANQGEPLCRGGGFISRRQYEQLSEEAKERLRPSPTK